MCLLDKIDNVRTHRICVTYICITAIYIYHISKHLYMYHTYSTLIHILSFSNKQTHQTFEGLYIIHVLYIYETFKAQILFYLCRILYAYRYIIHNSITRGLYDKYIKAHMVFRLTLKELSTVKLTRKALSLSPAYLETLPRKGILTKGKYSERLRDN